MWNCFCCCGQKSEVMCMSCRFVDNLKRKTCFLQPWPLKQFVVNLLARTTLKTLFFNFEWKRHCKCIPLWHKTKSAKQTNMKSIWWLRCEMLNVIFVANLCDYWLLKYLTKLIPRIFEINTIFVRVSVLALHWKMEQKNDDWVRFVRVCVCGFWQQNRIICTFFVCPHLSFKYGK